MPEVTQSGSNGNPEGGSGKPDKKVGYSDRRLKENIVEIGKHSSGIALYLLDYKNEYHVPLSSPSCENVFTALNI